MAKLMVSMELICLQSVGAQSLRRFFFVSIKGSGVSIKPLAKHTATKNAPPKQCKQRCSIIGSEQKVASNSTLLSGSIHYCSWWENPTSTTSMSWQDGLDGKEMFSFFEVHDLLQKGGLLVALSQRW